MILAIDGPAGSGKSTVAKRVASRLGYRYLDTGAMYRAVAVRALELNLALDDEDAVASLAAREPVAFTHAGDDALASIVSIGGVDVTQTIRTPEADAAVSHIARLPSVRKAMVAQQRAIARDADVVVEGRDIGTVVFPDAGVKVYLTASAEQRARRRTLEQEGRGHSVDAADVAASMARRDELDSTRDVAPLAAAPDAVTVDTSELSIDEVVERVATLATGDV